MIEVTVGYIAVEMLFLVIGLVMLYIGFKRNDVILSMLGIVELLLWVVLISSGFGILQSNIASNIWNYRVW